MHHFSNSRQTATRLIALAVLAAIAAPAYAQSLLPLQGQVVAKIGDAPIGLAVGETIGTTTPVDPPAMDRNGTLLFRGRLVGGTVGTLNDRALFLGHTSADLHVIARTNGTDPSGTYPNSQMVAVTSTTGLPTGSTSTLFTAPRISPTGGLVMFATQLYDGGNPGVDGLFHTGPSLNDNFLYWGVPGSLQILAQRRATVMPGGALINGQWGVTTSQSTALNSSGVAVFPSAVEGGDVVGTTNDTAWITGIPGSLSYMIREGDAVPACGGATIANIVQTSATVIALNEAGFFLHEEKLLVGSGAPAVTANDDQVIFLTIAGVHNVFWREGDPAVDATGAPIPGVFYGPPTGPLVQLLANGLSPTGNAAFTTTLQGPGVTPATDSAIFAGSLGSLKMIVREGDVVPGFGGETFATMHPSTCYTDAAGVAFGATMVVPGVGGLTINNDSILCTGKPGNITVIAREGDPAPSIPGFVFGSLNGAVNFASGHRVNDRGQIIFNFPVNDGVTSPNALFSYDPLHGLHLQVANGDVFGGLPVNSCLGPLTFSSGDGNTLGFSENGDFAVAPTLAPSGTGSFIARGHLGSLNGTPSAVPVAGGVPHNLKLDVTPAYGNQFYFILATGLGTDVGFPHPLNFGITVPIDFDPTWTTVSQAFVNSALWTNTLFVTDANGEPLGGGPISFNMPPGYPGFLGTTLKHSALLFDGALVGTFATEPTTCYLY